MDAASKRLVALVRGIPESAGLVLVRGERGSGRNAVAALLHRLSRRADAPLVRMDCGACPPEWLEAELFGVARPAGASQGKPGYLEVAGAGTLVLDEVASLPMAAQARLLRTLEERKFCRLGGSAAMPLQARIVALSTVDLGRALARRTLREELYYLLRIACLTVPPLRDRPADIRPLADHFLARLAGIHRRPQPRLSEAAAQALRQYWFPGNVRELRDLMERLVQTCAAPEIVPQDLPTHLRRPEAAANGHRPSLEEVERAHIAEVLEFTRGKKTQAAAILGISRKTLLEKRKRYGLD